MSPIVYKYASRFLLKYIYVYEYFLEYFPYSFGYFICCLIPLALSFSFQFLCFPTLVFSNNEPHYLGFSGGWLTFNQSTHYNFYYRNSNSIFFHNIFFTKPLTNRKNVFLLKIIQRKIHTVLNKILLYSCLMPVFIIIYCISFITHFILTQSAYPY